MDAGSIKYAYYNIDIRDRRNIFNAAHAVRKQDGRDYGNGGVFCTADGYLAFKPASSVHKYLFHRTHSQQ